MNRRELLIAAASVAAMAGPKAANAQSRDIKEFNVRREAENIVENIARNLQTPIARFGLVAFGEQFNSARIAKPVIGYENQGQFIGLTKVYLAPVIQVMVSSEPITLRSSPDESFFSPEEEGLKRNLYDNLTTVLEAARSVNSALRILDDLSTLRSQLTISILLWDRARELWKQCLETTCIYPFCYRRA